MITVPATSVAAAGGSIHRSMRKRRIPVRVRIKRSRKVQRRSRTFATLSMSCCMTPQKKYQKALHPNFKVLNPGRFRKLETPTETLNTRMPIILLRT